MGISWSLPIQNSETFEKRLILFKFKKEENMALMLQFVQPHEYIEYFEDSAKASLRAKFESDVGIGQKGALCKGLINHILDLPLDTDENIFESAQLYNIIRPDMIDTFKLNFFPKAEIIEDAVALGSLSDEDRRLIESGDRSEYINPYSTKGETTYDRYNLFFNMIPLLVELLLMSPIRFDRYKSPWISSWLSWRCDKISFGNQKQDPFHTTWLSLRSGIPL